MEQINIIIERADVMTEVDKVTDYTGSKMDDNDTTRDRIVITDDDITNLSRFWEEAATSANDYLKDMFVSATRPESADNYDIILAVSKNFHKGLVPSVQSDLRSFFIRTIVAKWFRFTNKQEADQYFAEANRFIDDALRKLYSRRRPSSPRTKNNS